ncbi:MAG: phospho-N-acetylmuramoyl-pentapeptide-transferase [bacterium]|jgi:phospho-N-acetylmuramoyl-pentapeptide-transferase|nr:phospho-N-acetylmuramoyl-pentapeptide-transferase [bacterium]
MNTIWGAAIAFAVPLLLVLLLGRPVISLLKNVSAGQIVREDGPVTHLSKQGTPTMGGLLIVIAATIGILLSSPVRQSWPVLFVLWGYSLLGFWDDAIIVLKHRSLGLKARHKLFYQFLLAILAVLIAREHAFDGTLWPIFLSVLWIFALVSTANAVNLTDGLDGLAAGTLVLSFGAYAVIGYIIGAHAQSVQALALAGGCLGFLVFNRHPAAIFMGDTGSLGLGAALGMLGLMTGSPWLLIVVGMVFVIEALSVIFQVFFFRLTGGRRLFRMSPLHHHFELSGLSEVCVVYLFWIAALMCGMLGIAMAG